MASLGAYVWGAAAAAAAAAAAYGCSAVLLPIAASHTRLFSVPHSACRWKGDSIVFAFGSLQGTPLSAAAVEERDYLMWMEQQDFADEVRCVLCAVVGVGRVCVCGPSA